jgi:hypothetical protein
VTLILATLDRIKEILDGEQRHMNPRARIQT